MINQVKMDTTATQKGIEDLKGGISLMMIFTACWALIAEFALKGRDFYAVAFFTAAVLAYFLNVYIQADRIAVPTSEALSTEEAAKEKAKDRRFYIIFAAEGLAILIIKNVLANSGHDNAFFPALALIVGLHFFPLGMTFKRKFYYFIGAWMCLAGIAGIVMTGTAVPVYMITTFVALACLLATSANGFRIIYVFRQRV